MKILVSAGNIDSLAGFRLPLLRALRRAGHEVHACAPAGEGRARLVLEAEGVRFHEVRLHRAAISPLADLRYAWSIYSLVRRIGAKGLFAYTHKPICLGVPAAAAAGASVRVGLITGLGYAFTSGGGIRRRVARLAVECLYRLALPRATHLFFQNKDDLADFAGIGLLDDAPVGQLVSGSGVPLEEFLPAALPEGPPVFLMLSRLLADKGVREYAAAAALVKARVPGARCVLAGPLDSNPSSIQEAEIRGWSQSGAIEYLGPLEDVRPAIRACTVYVLPSYREGTPRSVLEAMAIGRPILTTDAPGCRETLLNLGPVGADGIRRADNGLAVPVANGEALARAMCELAGERSQLVRCAEASRRYASERFDAVKVAGQLAAPFL